MNPFSRLFNCPRGRHVVGHQQMHELSKHSGWMRLDLDGMTFFRCQHCSGRFVTVHTSDSLNDPARPVAKALYDQLPVGIIAALTTSWWWPEQPSRGRVHDDGCYHGPATDPLMPKATPPKTRGSMMAPCSPPPPRPSGAFHGGPLPGNPDLSTPEGLAALQAMLPKGDVPAPFPADVTRGILEDILEKKMDPRHALKDKVFLTIAKDIAQLGTCCRLKVGAIFLTKEGRVAGMGYNGAGPGMPHCDPQTCNATCRCSRTAHAEVNALANMAGVPFTAYLTHEPCVACAKSIILAGVRRVVYISPYTSIAAEERIARQEWIDHYGVSWQQGSPQEQA